MANRRLSAPSLSINLNNGLQFEQEIFLDQATPHQQRIGGSERLLEQLGKEFCPDFHEGIDVLRLAQRAVRMRAEADIAVVCGIASEMAVLPGSSDDEDRAKWVQAQFAFSSRHAGARRLPASRACVSTPGL